MSVHETVLICNAGSASLKLSVIAAADETPTHADLQGDADSLLQQYKDWLNNTAETAIVLHRIVHAGEVTEKPQKLDADLKSRIRHWQHIAPLHNPLALDLIELTEQCWPTASQYAIFDSGLFNELPKLAKKYALPPDISTAWPIQRYGFHGLAHRSQIRTLQQQGDFKRVISLQLGGGTSAAAWLNNQVIDTTMGFSPLEGLPMGSRSGTVDPGILLHLLAAQSLSPESLQKLLYSESGLKALSGGMTDMRDLLASKTEAAEFAVSYYCYQLRKVIGAYAAILGGIDAVTIGGGIGEHQATVRTQIFADMAHLSLTLSETANKRARGVTALHDGQSATAIWLTPVDEASEMLHQYTTFRHLHRL